MAQASPSYPNPFSTAGRWRRGNLHTHTTRSDGKRSPAEAAAWYREHGYDFLALTDHDYDFRARTDHDYRTDVEALSDERFLVLPGVETHPGQNELGTYFEMVAVGCPSLHNYTRRDYPVQDAIDRLRADGAIVFLAHPAWSGMTVREVMPLEGLAGLEVLNAGCFLTGKGLSTVLWDDLLARGRLPWGMAADDAHWGGQEYYDHGGGWIMLKAAALTTGDILAALATGQFYATQGPEIHDFQVTGGQVYVRCSPASTISCVSLLGTGTGRAAPAPDHPLTEVTIPVRAQRRYVRVECTDFQGRKAWTQPVLL